MLKNSQIFFGMLLVLVIVTVAFSQASFADLSATNDANQPVKPPKTYNKVKFNAPGDKEKVPTEIKGVCSVVASASNPIAGACVNVVLVLNHADGSEYVKNRTTPQGMFSFEAEAGQKYQLALGSKLFEIVSPSGLLEAGQKIDLKLRQK